MKSNHLLHETSPYLQQHAYNPVDWYPWDKAALDKARRLDRPILLSIGYSACHWCHVMAHESFEDVDTANVMNSLFVNIKVDREERPDLDKIYQMAHHILTQRTGGWPLTLFLTPDDHTPFFAGTYFPVVQKFNMPSFIEILNRVADFYQSHRNEIRQQNDSLRALLKSFENTTVENGIKLNLQPLDHMRGLLDENYDPDNGGFGKAPKFPHPTNIQFLLQYWAKSYLAGSPDSDAYDMVNDTSSAIAQGGMYDQIAGGFFRYSVDEKWRIPHFEKMLYDNAALLENMVEIWQVSKNSLYMNVIKNTGAWVIEKMQSKHGGYFSTLDADSDGGEGSYYVWTPEEIKTVLNDPMHYEICQAHFGLDQTANFEHRWHLFISQNVCQLAEKYNQTQNDIVRILDEIKTKLIQHRNMRKPPGRDEKILTSWNGLMIKGMAKAGRLIGNDKLISSATDALDFIHANLWNNGRLLACYKDNRARFSAYLDDYVFLLDGILELLQCRWRNVDCLFAIELADILLSQFEDKNTGGFYFTANDHESLLYRQKPFADESTPAGNGIAARVLIKLGHLIGNTQYIDSAEKTLYAAWPSMCNTPHVHATLLMSLNSLLNPEQFIVLRGKQPELDEWHQRCSSHYTYNRFAVAIAENETNLPGLLGDKPVIKDSKVTAYVCAGSQCLAPIQERDRFETFLAQHELTQS